MTRRPRIIDPLGWDEAACRRHDVEPTTFGLLHYSTCWCRQPHEFVSDPTFPGDPAPRCATCHRGRGSVLHTPTGSNAEGVGE